MNRKKSLDTDVLQNKNFQQLSFDLKIMKPGNYYIQISKP